MVNGNMMDTEYLGGYITRITHYDPWDELVEVEHTQTYVSGYDSNGNPITSTMVYYTTEREYHSDKWSYCTSFNTGENFCSEKEFSVYKDRLQSKEVFRDMKRDYYKIDGDAHDIFWDKSIAHVYDITKEHNYENRIKASHSNTIFKYSEISKDKAKELGLFDYPSNKDRHQNPILGREVRDEDSQYIRYLNAVYGKQKEFRMYVLFFEDKDLEISEMQKAYWQGGNKNEFVVCLGVQKDSIVWCNPFSWCDRPKLETATKEYFIEHPKINLTEYGKFISPKINTDWERKNFEDFRYIRIGLSKGEYIALMIVMLIINVLLSINIIGNRYENRIEKK